MSIHFKALLVLITFSLISLLNAQGGGFDLHLGYGKAMISIPGIEQEDLLQSNQANYHIKLHAFKGQLGLEANLGLGNSPLYDNFQGTMATLGHTVLWQDEAKWRSRYLTVGPSLRLLDSKLNWLLSPQIGFFQGLSPDLNVSIGNNQLVIFENNVSKAKVTYGLGSSLAYSLSDRIGLQLSANYQTSHPFRSGRTFNVENLGEIDLQNPVAVATELLEQEQSQSDFSHLALSVGLSIHLGSGNRSGSRGSVFSIPINAGKCFRKCRKKYYKECKATRPDCSGNYRSCVKAAKQTKKSCKSNCSGSKKQKRNCKKTCKHTFKTAKEQCKIVRDQCKRNRKKCKKSDYDQICRKEC